MPTKRRAAARKPRIARVLLTVTLLASTMSAHASEPTEGFPEPVLQWGVQAGETCEDIAEVMYGSAGFVGLVRRYNAVSCTPGAPLEEGLTLVLPASATELPTAVLKATNPEVRSRPPGGAWSEARSGQSLQNNTNVNTLDSGLADIQFADRTRIFMAENTLVVIYDTAERSAQQQAPLPKVEVNQGEIRAGLAALRGEPVDIAVPGGGTVRAESTDTVIDRKGERTTVAVFDGQAAVQSGGKSVTVPTEYGTRFVGAQAPIEPRPLPPAPTLVNTPPTMTVASLSMPLTASWEAVPDALAYRVELARDAAFGDMMVREEVGAEILSFRAENLPPGRYFFRVRAIDNDEFLGIASQVETATVIDGVSSPVQADATRVHPYGTLRLSGANDVEVALVPGAYAALPVTIDFAKARPAALLLRSGGESESSTVVLSYVKTSASLSTERTEQGLLATVQFQGFEGIDIDSRVAPTLRVHGAQGARDVRLDASSGYRAHVPATTERLVVLDASGRVLATLDPSFEEDHVPEAPPDLVPMPRLGLTAPHWHLAPRNQVFWWSPTADNAVSLSTGADYESDEGGAAMARLRATGAVGPVGLEGSIRSNASSSTRPEETSAFVGARIRALRVGASELELGPGMRFGLPVSAEGPAPRIEPGVAIGGATDDVTFLASSGVRVRLSDDEDRTPTDPMLGYLVVGGTYDAATWLRLAAHVDGSIFVKEDKDAGGTGGLTAAIEGGEHLFFSASGRASPFVDDDAVFGAQLSVGVRQ